MLTNDENAWMGQFFRALKDAPLEPATDKRYIPLYSRPDLQMADAVRELHRVITWSGPQSTQLLSGHRGTGKSTELRRLRDLLRAEGAVVVVADIEDYLNASVPVDVPDFLMFLAGAFGDALVAEKVIDEGDLKGGFWARAAGFLRRIEVEEVALSGKAEPTVHGTKLGEVGAELKLNLKEDVSFRARLQKRMAGHVGTLKREVEGYFAELVALVRKKRNAPDARVVYLVDSIEHIRGTFSSADEVQASVEALIVGQYDKLRFQNLHMVLTVPPWLKVRHAAVDKLYDGFEMLTAIKVSEKRDGAPFPPGVQAFEAVATARGDWQRLLGSRERLERLILASGGHLRDLLRLLTGVLVGTDTLPVSEYTFERAISKIKNGMLPIADEHAVWMSHIRRTQRASLEEAKQLPDLARFLDSQQVLAYRNGDEWYDVHPLIADEVTEQAADVLRRRGG